jgi:hypothetical protein
MAPTWSGKIVTTTTGSELGSHSHTSISTTGGLAKLSGLTAGGISGTFVGGIPSTTWTTTPVSPTYTFKPEIFDEGGMLIKIHGIAIYVYRDARDTLLNTTKCHLLAVIDTEMVSISGVFDDSQLLPLSEDERKIHVLKNLFLDLLEKYPQQKLELQSRLSSGS